MARRPSTSIAVRVHDRGDRRLDGILRLIEEASRPRPIPDVLGTLAGEVAAIAHADVASIYVREGELLVMRANVGFPSEAVGNVRLRVGEGITGFVAECLRPVSVAVARTEAHYKHVPGLGEEKFPSFLAVPLLVGGSATGVLVLQRRADREFSREEVALAAALAAPVTYALERAEARRQQASSEKATTSRSARLEGTPVAPGPALGRAELWPIFEGVEIASWGREIGHAFEAVTAELGKSRRRIERSLGSDAAGLAALWPILQDGRLRELMVRECRSVGISAGLGAVARQYARASTRGAVLEERAAEIEDLCLLVAARAADMKVPSTGAVLVAQRLTTFAVLAAAAHRASAVVLADRVDDSGLAAVVARAARLPAVSEVAGLFAWIRPGDRILVDGAAGIVRINPPATAIARHRARAKRAQF